MENLLCASHRAKQFQRAWFHLILKRSHDLYPQLTGRETEA